MAKTYNTIGTFTAGAILTAAQMNAIGTNVNNYRVPPACRAYNNANITLANASGTILTLNSEDFDTDSMHSLTTNTERLTVTTPGIYVVSAEVKFDINAAGMRYIAIIKNAATYVCDSSTPSTGGGTFTEVNVTGLVSMANGDYFSLYAYQNSGGNLAARGNVTPNGVWLSAAWVGQVS